MSGRVATIFLKFVILFVFVFVFVFAFVFVLVFDGMGGRVERGAAGVWARGHYRGIASLVA